MKFYTNKQGLYQSKNFRKVFVDKEIGFLYTEVALFNILFDEEDWEANVLIKGYEVNSRGKEKEIYTLKSNKKVTKDKNIVYFREGYGNNSKTYWGKGHYRVKAYMGNDLLGKNDVFVEDAGEVTSTLNPYFDILRIRFYMQDANEKSHYLSQFNEDGTKYIYTSLEIRNKLKHDWKCEIEYMYFNEENQMVGYFTEFKEIKSKVVNLGRGWGSSTGSWWKPGKYTAKILFMGKLIAIGKFEVGEKDIVATDEAISKSYSVVQSTNNKDISAAELQTEKSLDELLESLIN